MLALWQELPATPGGSLACPGGLAGACSLSGAGGLVGIVLSLSGTVRGLVYLGDVIDYLFLTLRSLQVFLVAVRMGDDESLPTLVCTIIDDQGDDKCRQSGTIIETMCVLVIGCSLVMPRVPPDTARINVYSILVGQAAHGFPI